MILDARPKLSSLDRPEQDRLFDRSGFDFDQGIITSYQLSKMRSRAPTLSSYCHAIYSHESIDKGLNPHIDSPLPTHSSN